MKTKTKNEKVMKDLFKSLLIDLDKLVKRIDTLEKTIVFKSIDRRYIG